MEQVITKSNRLDRNHLKRFLKMGYQISQDVLSVIGDEVIENVYNDIVREIAIEEYEKQLMGNWDSRDGGSCSEQEKGINTVKESQRHIFNKIISNLNRNNKNRTKEDKESLKVLCRSVGSHGIYRFINQVLPKHKNIVDLKPELDENHIQMIMEELD